MPVNYQFVSPSAGDVTFRYNTNAASVVGRQEAFQLLLWLSRLLLTPILAAVLGIFFVFLCTSAVSAANTALVDLRSRLQELRTASSVVLMIIPYPTYFLMALDEVELRKASCQYEINPGPTFDEVLNILDSAITEYKIGPKPNADLRVGIVFKTDSKVIWEFYFNDLGGSFNLLGFSGDHAIAALASLPKQLSALVTLPSVTLIKDPLSRCPHA